MSTQPVTGLHPQDQARAALIPRYGCRQIPRGRHKGWFGIYDHSPEHGSLLGSFLQFPTEAAARGWLEQHLEQIWVEDWDEGEDDDGEDER
jgi:hypothetical protein